MTTGEHLTRAVVERQPSGPSLRLAFGKVTATTPSLQVALDGSTTAVTVKRMASYSSPVTDDYVAVLVAGNDRLVIGKVA